MKIDYRLLLWKYIGHVGAYEGTDFLFAVSPGKEEITQEELTELKKLSSMEKYEPEQ